MCAVMECGYAQVPELLMSSADKVSGTGVEVAVLT